MNKNTVTRNGVEFKGCNCGCEEPVKPKSTYLPGHDARHAGQVARDVAAKVLEGKFKTVLDAGSEFSALPSQALREKSARSAIRIVEKAQGKPAERKASPKAQAKQSEVPTTGAIKIGRWTYPVRMSNAGKVERNEKRDGSGTWLPVSGNAAQNVDWA